MAPGHGITAYNEGCRCDVCRAARSEKYRARLARLPRPVEGPRHGPWRQGELRREAIVAAVADLWLAKGWAPTLREVAEEVGLAAPSTVHSHVRILVDAGILAMDYGVPRSLRVVEHAREPG